MRGGGVSPTGTGTQVYTPPNINYTPGVQTYGGQNLGQLTEYINSLQRTAQTLANQARIPGAAGLEAQSSENIGADLRGEIDPDTLRLMQQQAAERGVSRVGAGSPNESAAYLQALGLTSYARKKAGQEELTGAYARNPAAPLFDPSKMLLTPAEADQLRLDQERLRLAGVTEANRTALEQQRLAQDAVLRPSGGAYTRGGGGGGFGAGTSSVPDYSGVIGDPRPRYDTTGATGQVLGKPYTFGQEQWWESIGYGNKGQGSPETEADVWETLGVNPDWVYGDTGNLYG